MKSFEATQLDYTTTVLKCLNAAACNVVNDTVVQCAEHAAGLLCAVCEDGFVPDAGATNGRCRACPSSVAERWGGKVALLACGAFVFFFIGLLVVIQPAPVLKIDAVIIRLHIRRIVRRVRKQTLLRLHDSDRNQPFPVIDSSTSAKFKALLAANDLDAAVELRRVAYAARSAGRAALTTLEDAEASGAATINRVAIATVEQAGATMQERAEETIENILGAPDVDASLGEAGASGLHGSAAGAVGGASGVFTSVRVGFKSLLNQTSSMLSVGQWKIALGNLQINASLTVVFAIPWPPVYTQFLEILNIFKLDLFKGFAFAAPCLHSSHFMSLAGFVAAPLVLMSVFALSFGCAGVLVCIIKSSSRDCRRCARKFSFGKATMASAGNATIKLTLVVILFIYPTICSKVFTTFKCVDVGGGQLFMVADMSVECLRGEWLFWAAVSGVAMVVYVIGIPLLCVLLLWVAHRRGTLQYPRVDADHITPVAVSAAVRRTEEYFRNRVAYGSLYDQVRCIAFFSSSLYIA